MFFRKIFPYIIAGVCIIATIIVVNNAQIRLQMFRVIIEGKQLDIERLEREVHDLTSTDGYEIPKQDYLVFPLFPGDQVYVTSQFGNRPNPFRDNSGPIVEESLHKGIDFTNLKQSTVRATVSGTVIEHYPPPNGYWRGDGVFGGKIIIEDSNGYQHVYAHLSESYVGPNFREVEAGDVIGRMGRTGRTTGTHLHYEIRRLNEDGSYTWYDPAYYFDIVIDDYNRVLFPSELDSKDIFVIGD